MKETRPWAAKMRGIFLPKHPSGESVPLYLKGLRPKAAVALGFFILTFLIFAQPCVAETGTASWYSVESCKQEGTWQKYGGKTASGEVFDDEKLTCASWDYDFGTILRITNTTNNRKVIVCVTDRGPSKRLYRKGRIIDLSKSAFNRIACLKQGIVEVQVEIVNEKTKQENKR